MELGRYIWARELTSSLGRGGGATDLIPVSLLIEYVFEVMGKCDIRGVGRGGLVPFA